MLSDIIAPGKLRAGDPQALAVLVAIGGWAVVKYCEQAGVGDEVASAVALTFVEFRRRAIRGGDEASPYLDRILLECVREAVDEIRGGPPPPEHTRAAEAAFARANAKPLSPRLATGVLHALVGAAPVEGDPMAVRTAAERSYAEAYAAAQPAPPVAGEGRLSPASALLQGAADASGGPAEPGGQQGARRAAAQADPRAAAPQPPTPDPRAAAPQAPPQPPPPDQRPPDPPPPGQPAPPSQPSPYPSAPPEGVYKPGPHRGGPRQPLSGRPRPREEPAPSAAGPARTRRRKDGGRRGGARKNLLQRGPAGSPPAGGVPPLLARWKALSPRWRAAAGAAVLIVFVLALLSSRGDDRAALEPDPSPPAATSESGQVVRGAPREPITASGTTVEVVAIRNASWAREIRDGEPRSGTRWVTVSVRVRNLTRRELVIRGLGYRLLTSRALVVGPTIADVSDPDKKVKDGRIPIGARASMHLGFEVPEKATELMFALEPGGLEEPTVLVALGEGA